jgi:hypothetical protein
MDLKALAYKVLERNKACNSGATGLLQRPQLRAVPMQQKLQGKERPEAGNWEAKDWTAYFCERAAIAEYDGDQSRENAEAQAHNECINEWRIQHPPPANDGRTCALCDEVLSGNEGLPFLCGSGGHTWLHEHCHTPWVAEQCCAARRVLVEMGIVEIEVIET